VLSASTDRGSTSGGARLGRAEVRDLIALGALALVLRAAWALVYGRIEGGAGDAPFFAQAAASLAGGDGYSIGGGAATAHAPPGFPFIVSLGYQVVGVHVKLALALNVVLGAATALLLYLVARAAMGRAAGLVAGGAFAILPAPIFFTGLVLSETTFLFMLVGFLALTLLLPDRRWTPLVLGVLAGLAALTKGDGFLLAVIPAAMWWGSQPPRLWLRRVALLVAALALTVLPWTIRNADRMDAFVPVATNASAALWPGHNPEANGWVMAPPAELLARVPKGLNPTEHEVEETALLRGEARSWAIRNPHKEVGLIPRKLLALGDQASDVFPISFNDKSHRELGTSSLLLFSVLGDAFDYFLILLTLAALALIGVRRLWRFHPLMRGALAYLAASLVAYGFVFFGESRYRLPMEPLMILLATPLILAIWQRRTTLREAP
jgi:4-amino-4-deoxy-L-arabinose transferase-like glycosyltransferase